jgi:hypothetical protein
MKTQKECISSPYLELQRELHSRPEGYGGKGAKWADTVLALVRQFDARSVLDYGCGRGSLARKLAASGISGLRVSEYDPAIPGKDHPPLFADLVTCTDVLEHIEPDRLDAVLTHLRQLARKAVFLVIALDPANKTLKDGRNAHLILESPEWWEARLRAVGFTLLPPAQLPPWPGHYTPEKRQKRWLGVGLP